ncbi:MAG: hypothetical protein HC814_05890, partial [Rhodobacteraceae bacterium]|nr:hypothetical protein [Paracoccaceae bacterium]
MARVYDLVMTHKLDADDFFIHRVQEQCAARGLNFFLVEPLWVEEFHTKLARDHAWSWVLVNLHSEHHLPNDPFTRLVRLASTRHVTVIDEPEAALAAFDKARLHPLLVGAGLIVPFTVIVPTEHAATVRFTSDERAALGSPFVIKPSLGYGRQGVLLDARGEADLVRSLAAWRDPFLLAQRKIVPRDFAGDPAYFRVFHCFGEVWLAWWDPATDRYRAVTPSEEGRFRLHPLREIMARVAALTGMNLFSSEIAVTEDDEFVLIDYVNDQCHLLAQSADPRIGVPDLIVAG